MNGAAQLLTQRFKAASAAVQQGVSTAVAAAYDDVDPDNIVDSMDDVNDAAAPTIIAGQTALQALTAAFYGTMAIAQLGVALPQIPTLDIAGTRPDGSSLRDGMDALGPMILGQISGGAELQGALDFGRYALDRYASAEVIGAGDREAANQQDRPEIVGWEGVVSADACAECQAANEGEHDLSDELYRHGNCDCDKVPIYGTGG